jgi:hypothetical protein
MKRVSICLGFLVLRATHRHASRYKPRENLGSNFNDQVVGFGGLDHMGCTLDNVGNMSLPS